VFESNRGTKVNISAENPLGSQFQVGWQGKAESKFKTKAEVTQEKVSILAADLQGKYFSTNQESTRRIVAEMKAILVSVEAACKAHENEEVGGKSFCCCFCLFICLFSCILPLVKDVSYVTTF